MTEVMDTQAEAQFYRQPGSGNPFKSQRDAANYMTGVGLSEKDWMPAQCADGNGGWEVRRIKRLPEPIKVKEKYYRVRFHAKRDPNDYNDVVLSVNGEVLQIQRERDVIIPGKFKECADHATYQDFRQEPGKPRKVVGTIQVFPYHLIGEATEEEYQKMFREGSRKQAAAVAKHGFDVDPDALEN